MPWFPTNDEVVIGNLFPKIPADFVETMCFELAYSPHGGGGLAWGRGDVLRMPFDEAVRMVDKLHDTRKKEAAALKRAYGKAAR